MSKYSERDRKLKSFVARYRVGLHRTISTEFFGGPEKSCGHVLRRFSEADLFSLHSRSNKDCPPLPGGLSYVTITTKLAIKLGVPKERAKLKPQAIDNAVATLFWCKAHKSKKRIRLEFSELHSLLANETGAKLPEMKNVTHCVSDAGDKAPKSTMWRVYPSSTDTGKTLDRLQSHIANSYSNDALKGFVRDRRYGFIVLSPNPKKAKDVARAIRTSGIQGEALVSSGVGPNSSTIAQALRENWSPDID